MAETNHPTKVFQLLRDWIAELVAPPGLEWLEKPLGQIPSGDRQALFLAFGMVPRKTGKADLDLSEADLAAAHDARDGWDPRGWSVDQAVRTLLVLSLPADDPASYVETLDMLFAAGEVGELVALYQALPLLPHQSAHVLRAAEGVRTNMKAVFCAVAHRNPYPAEQFDEDAFNQMVLKCLFVSVPLDPVLGLDRRANPRLMRMLLDYAHERWAASRSVCPELWRPVGPCADDAALADLERVLLEGSTVERHAAALALASSPHPGAQHVLDEDADLAQQARSGEITWQKVAADAFQAL